MEKSLVPSLDEIRSHAEDHRVTVRGNDLIIVNYNQKVQFNPELWDETTKRCRGLILRLDKRFSEATEIREVVALPFAKFFNAGETIAGTLHYPSGAIAEVTEKVDGSLGILYRDTDGTKKIATRGSLLSEQAHIGTQLLQKYNLTDLPENLTLLFEIIYPENRIVVDYQGKSDLILLGVRDRFTGEDWFYPAIADLGARFGLTVVPHAKNVTLDQAMELRYGLDANHEGWVVRSEDGQRYKIKGEQYRLLHKFLSHLSERQVLDKIADGSIDLMLEATPDPWRPKVLEWKSRIESDTAERVAKLTEILATAPKETRKEFALWVKAEWPGAQHYLFAMLDSKDPKRLIYKDIREELSAEPLVEPDAG